MNFLSSLYLSILRTTKEILRFMERYIRALLPKNQAPKRYSWQTSHTLEVLSSLSYRTGELKGFLKLVADSVSELMGLDWAVVTLCQEGVERILASSIDMGYEEDYKANLHGTLTEAVINTGCCLFVENTSMNTEYGEPPEGYFAYLGAPLRLPTGEIIGTICSFHRQPRKFTVEDMKLIEIFAERAATAIDNYNLYEKQQEMNLVLKKSEEELRQIAENLEPLLWMYSYSGEPIYMSPMFERVWGIPIMEWYADGKVFLNAIHPDDRARVSAAFNSMFTNNISYDLEYRIIHPESIKIIHDRAFPIIDESGKVYRVAGIAEDITKRQQEQKQTIKALERLSEIGELATSIVHEVRNPLTTVMMGLNYFDRLELPVNAKKRLTLALDEAERLKRLLNEILDYARSEVIRPEPIDLNQLTLELIENITTTHVADRKQIRFNSLPEPIIISADKDKLKQVLINLLQNAWDAVSESEEISVQISSSIISEQVCIQIKNGGLPIPPELLPKLTMPFFTTKPHGSGLGLAIVKKIVDAHNGKLKIESSAIAGTVIIVELPVLQFSSKRVHLLV